MALLLGQFMCILFLVFTNQCQGHGILVRPASRAVRLATGLAPDSDDAVSHVGTCDGGICEWYTQRTQSRGNRTNCDPALRTMGVGCDSSMGYDWPCTPSQPVPWCAPGTAAVKSSCGIFSGGYGNRGRDMLDLPSQPGAAIWHSGGTANVTWSIVANHGGGYAYRLCPSNGAVSEECFQAHHLEPALETQAIVGPDGNVITEFKATRTNKGTQPSGSTWTRNPFNMEHDFGPAIPGLPNAFGRGPFRYGLRDTLRVPPNLAPGDYVLSFRWDSEQVQQVWSHCSDVRVVAGAIETGGHTSAVKRAQVNFRGHSTATAAATKATTKKTVCMGASIGLDTVECDAWAEFYDATDGPNWAPGLGSGLRTDPCGTPVNASKDGWDVKVKCSSRRDALHISELYLLGPGIRGTMPASFTRLTGLQALSIVSSNLSGELPSAMGDMASLSMLWLDHNPLLVGTIPSTLGRLALDVLELHRSGFGGRMPRLNYEDIADCTLGGMVFECPLPPGAETCGAVCK